MAGADDLFPIIEVRDVERSLVFWRDLLGGRVTSTFPGDDGTIAFASVQLGQSSIGIGGPASEVTHGSIILWAYVDAVDPLIERLRAAGVTIAAEPADQPWGERTARVLDPDGHVVMLGQRAPRS